MKKTKVPSLKEIEDNFSEWKPTSEERKIQTLKRNDEMRARAKKDANINQRVSSADLAALKDLADQMGMPYQTLLGSVIHRFVTGQLVDIREVRKVLPKLIVNRTEVRRAASESSAIRVKDGRIMLSRPSKNKSAAK